MERAIQLDTENRLSLDKQRVGFQDNLRAKATSDESNRMSLGQHVEKLHTKNVAAPTDFCAAVYQNLSDSSARA